MATIATLLSLAVLAATSSVPTTAVALTDCVIETAPFEPVDGQVLHIIGQDRDSMDAYVEGTGVVPAGFMTYTSVSAPVLGLHLPINFGGVSHGQHIVDTYPDSAVQVGLNINPPLAVSLGLFDVGIYLLGEWIRDAQRPVFLRIGYEFDHQNKMWDPEEFIDAWRHIVDRLREQDVSNVAFVWHSSSNPPYGGHPPAAWYPGDDYVDWAAVSIFRQVYNEGAGMPRVHAMADFAEARGKPLMIAESTPHGQRTPTGDAEHIWSEWFAPVIDFIDSRNVKAWSYINGDWEAAGWDGWGDTRVEANEDLKQLWLDEITQPRYLHASALDCPAL